MGASTSRVGKRWVKARRFSRCFTALSTFGSLPSFSWTWSASLFTPPQMSAWRTVSHIKVQHENDLGLLHAGWNGSLTPRHPRAFSRTDAIAGRSMLRERSLQHRYMD